MFRPSTALPAVVIFGATVLTELACSAGSAATRGGDGDSGVSGDGDFASGDGDLVVGDGDGSAGDGDASATECTFDASGQKVCSCIKVATWGALGTFGAVPGMDGTDAITAYLNENSSGEADYFASKPPINAESLAVYDVIILQDLSGWPAFTPDEMTAFDSWVRTGGGVISLNGYSADDNEMKNVNMLLAFTGMSYNIGSDTAGTAAANANPCAYCYGSSVPVGGWVTTHPIAVNIKDVGAFHGRSISAPEAEPVQRTTEGLLAAAKQVDMGRVFMFHDEWVTYNSQWTGQGIESTCLYNDPNNTCNDRHPTNDYTPAQFWFNSIKWVSNKECFIIDDVTVIR